MSAEAFSLPTILIRGRSVMALVVSPEWPLDDWLEALDEQIGRTKGLFGHRPVVAYLGVVPELRGNGYVEDLLAEITHLLAVAGAQWIQADTDLANRPMAAAFQRAGYRNFAVRIVLSAPMYSA